MLSIDKQSSKKCQNIINNGHLPKIRLNEQQYGNGKELIMFFDRCQTGGINAHKEPDRIEPTVIQKGVN